MAESLLILPGEPTPPGADDRAVAARALLRSLRSSLAELDRINAGIAAVHLATAIDHLRVQFNLDDEASETD